MAVASFNGKALWMGRNGFWKYEGGFLTPLNCPVLNDVFENIDDTYGPFRSYACHNGTFPEVWFFYPEIDQTECNRYIAYNYSEDFWFWGSLSRTAMFPGETYVRPYMGGTDGHIYEHEYGYTAAGTSRVGTIWAETGVLPLTNGEKGIIINSIQPANDHGASSTEFIFYTKQTPEGSERSYGPYYPRTDGYTDCRVTGKDVRIRIEATEDAEWSIGKFRFNVQPGTGR
jgi:hypothetical protein